MLLTGGITITQGVYLGVPVTPNTDPYFSNVVLLLHGDGSNGGTTISDNSSYNRTPSSLVNTITSSDQTLFGQNTIKSQTSSILEYATSIDFAKTDTWTLEFWIYPTSNSGSYFVGRSGLSYGATGGNPLGITLNNWGTTGGTTMSGYITINSWNYVVFTQNVSSYSTWINGTRTQNDNDGSAGSGSAEALGILNVAARNDLPSFEGYMSEFRYTQGVSRYSGATIPLQTAPWPNS